MSEEKKENSLKTPNFDLSGFGFGKLFLLISVLFLLVLIILISAIITSPFLTIAYFINSHFSHKKYKFKVSKKIEFEKQKNII